MSILLAAATNVAATVAATPAPTPEVIIKTIQAAPVVPENVLQLSQVLALAAAGAVTSLLHLVLNKAGKNGQKRFSPGVSRLLITLYSTVAGIAVYFLSNGLNFSASGIVAGTTAFLAFLGSTQGQKFLIDLVANLTATTTDPAGVAVPDLATDAPA